MSSSLKQTNEVLGGAEAIRRAAQALSNCREVPGDADSVLLRCEAARCSDWDVWPDQVTDLQLERWQQSNGHEPPTYIESKRGLLPACEWTVISYDAWGNREEGYEVNDEHRNGTVELAEDPTDAEVLDALPLMGWRVPEDRKNWLLEWTETDMCEISTRYGKPLGRLVKEGV